MNVGDLVKLDPVGNGRDMIGFIIRIDERHYGARQAFKVYDVPRGATIGPKIDKLRIGPTQDGIRDRVLVLWCNDVGYEYCYSNELSVISEGG